MSAAQHTEIVARLVICAWGDPFVTNVAGAILSDSRFEELVTALTSTNDEQPHRMAAALNAAHAALSIAEIENAPHPAVHIANHITTNGVPA